MTYFWTSTKNGLEKLGKSMQSCPYDQNHWPCTYCTAESPDSENAKCQKSEAEKGDEYSVDYTDIRIY